MFVFQHLLVVIILFAQSLMQDEVEAVSRANSNHVVTAFVVLKKQLHSISSFGASVNKLHIDIRHAGQLTVDRN